MKKVFTGRGLTKVEKHCTRLSLSLAVIRFNDYVSGLKEFYRIIMFPVLFEPVTLGE
jgi:hypothetical protein